MGATLPQDFNQLQCDGTPLWNHPLLGKPDKDAFDESIASKVERFCQAGGALPSAGSETTGHIVHFATVSELCKWMSLGVVDFAELFRGYGEATIRVREAGCTASEGFDKHAVTYERCWHLDTPTGQADCAWLIVYQLRPKVIHLGTPCTKMCLLGPRQVDKETKMQNEFTKKVALHQAGEGLGASIENPKGSLLFDEPEIVGTFGTVDAPKTPWSFYRSEGCQFKFQYPGEDDPGRPILKAHCWIANFDLSALELRCKQPAALLGASHEHRHARGGMHVRGVGQVSLTNYTGKYTAELATVYAKEVKKIR